MHLKKKSEQSQTDNQIMYPEVLEKQSNLPPHMNNRGQEIRQTGEETNE